MIRKLHLYLGTLFAPAILFFSFTGILQTIGLHEAEDAAAPRPAAWIVAIATLHKDQHLPLPKKPKDAEALAGANADHADHAEKAPHAAGPAATGAGPAKSEPPQNVPQTILKAFVLLMALGLIVSAALGIVIAITNPRTRRTAILMLVAGTIVPFVLVML